MLDAPDCPLAALTDYVIDSRLGHGAYSEVYAATHVATNTPVAIKRVFGDGGRRRGPDPAPSPGAREAAALERVRHPNVVRLLERVDLPHGGTALILERASIDVETLLTTGDAPLDPALIKTLTRCVLAALAAAHAAGVAHRDVKPGNVLLTGCGRVMLGDWGQAAATPAQGEAQLPPPPPALAPPAAPGGTRWYRPPEALAGGPAAVAPGGGAAADAWGAGALLAALLARGPLAAARSDVGQLARWAPFVVGGDGGLVAGGDGGGVCPVAAAAGWKGVGDSADAAALASALPDAPPAALTLVARLLAPDPASRLAPAAALESEWLWEAPVAAPADVVAAAVAVAAAKRPARVASAVALF